jgi:predicted nucleic acid-binding protein
VNLKAVLDSDGLIKLAKAGVLEAVLRAWECVIPQAVYEETVVRGKQAAYPDATEIERVIQAHHIPCKRPAAQPRARAILRGAQSLGAGEKEALHLYFAETADVIISDDARFLPLLARAGVPYLPPALALMQLVREGRIDRDGAFAHLERMRPFIRPEVHQRTRDDLEEMSVENEREEEST